MQRPDAGFFHGKEITEHERWLFLRRGTEVVVTGSTRNRFVSLVARHVGSNPTLSAQISLVAFRHWPTTGGLRRNPAVKGERFFAKNRTSDKGNEYVAQG